MRTLAAVFALSFAACLPVTALSPPEVPSGMQSLIVGVHPDDPERLSLAGVRLPGDDLALSLNIQDDEAAVFSFYAEPLESLGLAPGPIPGRGPSGARRTLKSPARTLRYEPADKAWRQSTAPIQVAEACPQDLQAELEGWVTKTSVQEVFAAEIGPGLVFIAQATGTATEHFAIAEQGHPVRYAPPLAPRDFVPASGFRAENGDIWIFGSPKAHVPETAVLVLHATSTGGIQLLDGPRPLACSRIAGLYSDNVAEYHEPTHIDGDPASRFGGHVELELVNSDTQLFRFDGTDCVEIPTPETLRGRPSLRGHHVVWSPDHSLIENGSPNALILDHATHTLSPAPIDGPAPDAISFVGRLPGGEEILVGASRDGLGPAIVPRVFRRPSGASFFREDQAFNDGPASVRMRWVSSVVPYRSGLAFVGDPATFSFFLGAWCPGIGLNSSRAYVLLALDADTLFVAGQSATAGANVVMFLHRP
ncbi:MAG: hypothetical protein U1E65_08820 [Myxococcota bacterium]